MSLSVDPAGFYMYESAPLGPRTSVLTPQPEYMFKYIESSPRVHV